MCPRHRHIGTATRDSDLPPRKVWLCKAGLEPTRDGLALRHASTKLEAYLMPLVSSRSFPGLFKDASESCITPTLSLKSWN